MSLEMISSRNPCDRGIKALISFAGMQWHMFHKVAGML